MRIKAFTITELVVALAISAIVTTIGYYAFRTIGHSVELKGNNLNQIEKFDELRFLLKNDFFQNHDWVIQESNSFYSNTVKISYTFQKDKVIISRDGSTETFQFNNIEFVKIKNSTNKIFVYFNLGNQILPIVVNIQNNVHLKSVQ